MRNVLRSFVPVIVVGVLAVHARAESEPIGPMLIVPGQTIDLHFPNLIPPHPDHKVLQFWGWAWADPGILPSLTIEFDYVVRDASGATTEFLLPAGAFDVLPSPALYPIKTHPIWLDFCPEEVSIHFSSNAPVWVQGAFYHECFAVPLPNAASMGGLILSLATLLPRRRAA